MTGFGQYPVPAGEIVPRLMPQFAFDSQASQQGSALTDSSCWADMRDHGAPQEAADDTQWQAPPWDDGAAGGDADPAIVPQSAAMEPSDVIPEPEPAQAQSATHARTSTGDAAPLAASAALAAPAAAGLAAALDGAAASGADVTPSHPLGAVPGVPAPATYAGAPDTVDNVNVACNVTYGAILSTAPPMAPDVAPSRQAHSGGAALFAAAPDAQPDPPSLSASERAGDTATRGLQGAAADERHPVLPPPRPASALHGPDATTAIAVFHQTNTLDASPSVPMSDQRAPLIATITPAAAPLPAHSETPTAPPAADAPQHQSVVPGANRHAGPSDAQSPERLAAAPLPQLSAVVSAPGWDVVPAAVPNAALAVPEQQATAGARIVDAVVPAPSPRPTTTGEAMSAGMRQADGAIAPIPVSSIPTRDTELASAARVTKPVGPELEPPAGVGANRSIAITPPQSQARTTDFGDEPAIGGRQDADAVPSARFAGRPALASGPEMTWMAQATPTEAQRVPAQAMPVRPARQTEAPIAHVKSEDQAMRADVLAIVHHRPDAGNTAPGQTPPAPVTARHSASPVDATSEALAPSASRDQDAGAHRTVYRQRQAAGRTSLFTPLARDSVAIGLDLLLQNKDAHGRPGIGARAGPTPQSGAFRAPYSAGPLTSGEAGMPAPALTEPVGASQIIPVASPTVPAPAHETRTAAPAARPASAEGATAGRAKPQSIGLGGATMQAAPIPGHYVTVGAGARASAAGYEANLRGERIPMRERDRDNGQRAATQRKLPEQAGAAILPQPIQYAEPAVQLAAGEPATAAPAPTWRRAPSLPTPPFMPAATPYRKRGAAAPAEPQRQGEQRARTRTITPAPFAPLRSGYSYERSAVAPARTLTRTTPAAQSTSRSPSTAGAAIGTAQLAPHRPSPTRAANAGPAGQSSPPPPSPAKPLGLRDAAAATHAEATSGSVAPAGRSTRPASPAKHLGLRDAAATTHSEATIAPVAPAAPGTDRSAPMPEPAAGRAPSRREPTLLRSLPAASPLHPVRPLNVAAGTPAVPGAAAAAASTVSKLAAQRRNPDAAAALANPAAPGPSAAIVPQPVPAPASGASRDDDAGLTVRVNIGRIRIEGAPAAAPRAAPFRRPAPALSLAQYAQRRNGRMR